MADTPTFRRPVNGQVTSPFGPRQGKNHDGIDFNAATGDPVAASAPGKVTGARPSEASGGYGNLVIIDHGAGFETYYAHLSAFRTKPGAIVEAGELVGLAGSTGNSTGPHVHFEIRLLGTPLDPAPLLAGGPAPANPERGDKEVDPGLFGTVMDPLAKVGELVDVLGRLTDGQVWIRVLGFGLGLAGFAIGLVLINRDTVGDATSIAAAASTGGASAAAKGAAAATTAASVVEP